MLAPTTGETTITPRDKTKSNTTKNMHASLTKICITQNQHKKLECGPIPNVMAAQPNIGGALSECSVIPFLVSCPKVWLTPAAGVPCSNAASIGECKTWTLSEFCTLQNSVRGQEPPKSYI